jgi:hypothetical protein
VIGSCQNLLKAEQGSPAPSLLAVPKICDYTILNILRHPRYSPFPKAALVMLSSVLLHAAHPSGRPLLSIGLPTPDHFNLSSITDRCPPAFDPQEQRTSRRSRDSSLEDTLYVTAMTGGSTGLRPPHQSSRAISSYSPFPESVCARSTSWLRAT